MNNYDAGLKREKMLAAFTSMIKPARIITNMSQEELAQKSGLPLGLIAGVENGMHRFHEPHYLALAAIFDSTKYTEDASIYRAVLRILTPEGETETGGEGDDFVLVRRWLDSFGENYGEGGTADDRMDDSLVENLVKDYDIYIDASAVQDENFPAFVSRLEPLLSEACSGLLVLSAAVEELSGCAEVSDDEEEKINISEALEYVRAKSEEGLIQIHDVFQDFDDSADILASIIADAPEDSRIAIITQDAELAKDLASGHQNVITARINDKGDLIMWR